MHTVREIWSAFTKTFYDGSNETHLFALNRYAFTIKHAGRPLLTYYVELVEIFQELDYYDKVIVKYLDDIVTYKKFITWLRVHIFFSGLDTHFEQIKGEVLYKDLSIDLDDTYAYVHRDYIYKVTLNVEPNNLQSSTLVAQRAKPQP